LIWGEQIQINSPSGYFILQYVYLVLTIGKNMVELTKEQATAIANVLGTLPANQCYNELTVLLQAISKANEPLEPTTLTPKK
jgi:hypothetical protein